MVLRVIMGVLLAALLAPLTPGGVHAWSPVLSRQMSQLLHQTPPPTSEDSRSYDLQHAGRRKRLDSRDVAVGDPETDASLDATNDVPADTAHTTATLALERFRQQQQEHLKHWAALAVVDAPGEEQHLHAEWTKHHPDTATAATDTGSQTGTGLAVAADDTTTATASSAASTPAQGAAGERTVALETTARAAAATTATTQSGASARATTAAKVSTTDFFKAPSWFHYFPPWWSGEAPKEADMAWMKADPRYKKLFNHKPGEVPVILPTVEAGDPGLEYRPE